MLVEKYENKKKFNIILDATKIMKLEFYKITMY